MPKSPGRPRGSRNKLALDVLNDAIEVWNELASVGLPPIKDDNLTKGKAALRQLYKQKPGDFAKWFGSILPREIQHENIISELTDDELREALGPRAKRPRDLTPPPSVWGRWDVSRRQVLQKVLENTRRRTGWQVVRVGVGTLRPTGRSDLRGRRSQAIADTADQRLPFGGPGSACRPMIATSSGGGGISADPPAECPVRHSMRPRPARSVLAPFQDDLDAASLIFPVPSGDCPRYPSSWSPVRPKYAGWLCSSRSSVRASDPEAVAVCPTREPTSAGENPSSSVRGVRLSMRGAGRVSGSPLAGTAP
jgi:hypothetical protein